MVQIVHECSESGFLKLQHVLLMKYAINKLTLIVLLLIKVITHGSDSVMYKCDVNHLQARGSIQFKPTLKKLALKLLKDIIIYTVLALILIKMQVRL